MSFTYPAFLFALSAIAIPIIIHLFNFRKFKTVYFSNVRFLKEVKQETQAKSKLKHLLVLISRILAILFLVLAFAQPFIPVENKKVIPGEKAVSIFIDNSFSMDAINKSGRLLDDAKKRALEIAAAYKPSDRFQLLTNDFEGRHQRLVNKEEFVELVDEVKISSSSRSLSEVGSRAFDVLQQSGIRNKVMFVLSDFQKSVSDLEKIKNDTSISVRFIPLVANEKSNVFVDSCWFETPVRQYNQVENLHVKIRNMSENVLENSSVRLFINGVQKTPASFSIDKDSETEIVLSFVSREPGIQHCRVEISDYPVTFDDKFYFTFEVAKNIPVLCINGEQESPFINKLFSDSLFIFRNASEKQLDYSILSSNKLILLNGLKVISSGLAQELKRFMSNGGSVVVFPSADSDLASYKESALLAQANYPERLDTVDTKVERINLEHIIYKDVFEKKTFSAGNLDLPVVNSHFSFSKLSRSNEEYLLKLLNGEIFFSASEVGKGKLYQCASPLDPSAGNFVKHAIFVPTMYQVAIFSQGSQPMFLTIGNNEAIETNRVLTGENVFHLRSTDNSFDLIPESQVADLKTIILPHGQITEAGSYDLYAGNEKILGASFNFDRKESVPDYYTSIELKDKLSGLNYNNMSVLEVTEQNLGASLSELDQGKKLWKLCVVLALLFLACEVLLLRFMK
jgi:hypothetical protein